MRSGATGCKGLLVTCLLGHSLSGQAVEQDAQFEELLGLSIEALSNITVSVASSHDQTIVEAPLIVSRYNRADLEKMGASSLREMLEFVPGVLTQVTQSGNGAIMSRGLVEAFNQKILFLLNEVPYRAPSHSATPLDGIPFDAISHIEVVRGPAAVYYGTNASAAVVNIVTLDQGPDSVRLSNKNHQTSAGGRVQFQQGEWWANLSLETRDDEGHDAHIHELAPSVGLPHSGNYAHSIDKDAYLLRTGYRDVTFMAQAFDTRYNEEIPGRPFIATDGLQYKGQLYHLNYSPSLGNTRFKVFADYNQFSLKFPIQNILVAFGSSGDGGFRFEDEDNNHRWRVGGMADNQLTENVSLLFGYDYEHRSTSQYQVFNEATGATITPILQKNTNHEQALYSQLSYQLQDLNIVLGGRYVDNKNSGKHTSPEVSMVYQLSPQQSLKLLFAEGFNSPNFVQQGIKSGPLSGNPDLSVEKISTYDLAYTYASDQQLFVANLFYIEGEDLIQRDVSTGAIRFDNVGKSTRSGLEVDYQLFKDEWSWFINVSYLMQGNDPDEDQSSVVAPEYLLSGGGSYRFFNRHSLGTSMKYVSERADAKEYCLMNLAYQFELNDLTLSAGINNLLDQEIEHADFQNLSANQLITDESGINTSFGISYRF